MQATFVSETMKTLITILAGPLVLITSVIAGLAALVAVASTAVAVLFFKPLFLLLALHDPRS